MVTSVTPASSPPQGGQRITVKGKNFGVRDDEDVAVVIGGQRCLDVRRVSDTEVECSAPRGVGAGRPVVVSIDSAQSSAAVNVFSFHGGCPRFVGTIIASLTRHHWRSADRALCLARQGQSRQLH